MGETKTTKAELAAHIDRVIHAMKGSDLAGLVNRLTELERETRSPHRAPFALVGEPTEGGTFTAVLEPFVLCEPTHLIVTPETAAHYELADFYVGSVSLRAGYDGGAHLPLDTFSAAYIHSDKLAAVQAWKADKCAPGQRMRLVFEARSLGRSNEVPPVRGLLWCNLWLP